MTRVEPTDSQPAITCLLTDIVGSLRRWEEDPPAMRQALRRHDNLVHEAVLLHGGRHHKARGEGDSHLATFAFAADAIRAACAIQLAHQSEPWPGRWPLLVRAAVHSGPVTDDRDEDVLGSVPSRCGRIRDAASGGQTLVSETSYALALPHVPEPIRLIPLGQHRFRDLQEPVRVYQLAHPDLPTDFPPIRSMEAVPNNLPIQLTSFTGRAQELAAVATLLESTRLVTLTGVGGCGKTRLALQAAADRLDRHPDGVFLVELAALEDPTLVPRSVAAVLGVPEAPGPQQTARLVEHLRSRQSLLLLDNCEHLILACAELVEHLLQYCPQLRVLATSREVLDVPGEVAFHVPALGLPAPEDVGRLQPALATDAVRLFIDRARSRDPAFALTGENVAAAAELCRRLDGLPLAIELAAANVDVVPVARMARELDEQLAQLPGRRRVVAARHRTTQSALEWSHRLLSPAEQLLFARLSVFAGGCTSSAAADVCGEDLTVGDSISDTLEHLVRKSMIVRDRDGQDGPRYRMLETLRAFGRRLLEERGELDDSLRRQVHWCRQLTAQIEPKLAGADQVKWLDRLEQETDNLRAAITYCIGSPQQAEDGLAIATSVWRLWQARGYMTEGRDYLARLEAVAAADCDPALRLRARRVAGNLAYYQADMVSASRLYEAALADARALALADDIAALLNNLALLDMNHGHPGAAYDRLRESLALRRAADDEQGLAGALGNLGLAAWYRGQLDAAVEYLDEGNALLRAMGDHWTLGATLTSMGTVRMAQGNLVAARHVLEEAVTLRREIGDRSGIADSACVMAEVMTVAGDLDSARALCDEALAIAKDDGDEWSEASAISALARIGLETGDHDTATEQFETCLDLARAQGRAFREAEAIAGLGQSAAVRGDLDTAAKLLQEALDRSGGVRLYEADCASRLARVRSAQGRTSEAAGLANQALAIRLESGDLIGLAASIEDFAGLACRRGEPGAGLRLVATAGALRERLGAPRLISDRSFLDPLLAEALQTVGKDAAGTLSESGSTDDPLAVAKALLRGDVAESEA